MKIYTTIRRAFRRWLLRTLEPCRQMVPLISQSMDRRLSPLEYFKLRLHRWVCAWCDRYFRQIRLLRRSITLRMAPAVEHSPAANELTHEARERISNSLSKHRGNKCG